MTRLGISRNVIQPLDQKEVREILAEGEGKAKQVAHATMHEVHEAMGIG